MIYYINGGTIGTIELNFNILNEERTVGKNEFPKSVKKECTILVNGIEGDHIPHLHIEGEDFSCCIQLFDNRFFTHGIHKDKLHKSDWKIFDKWMRQPNKKYRDKSNWEIAVKFWNDANGKGYLNNKVPLKIDEQPDYTTILPYKKEK